MWQVQFSSAYSNDTSTKDTRIVELENFLNIYSSHLCEELATDTTSYRYIFDDDIKYKWSDIRTFVINKEFDDNDKLMLKLASPQWRCEELTDLDDIQLPQYDISLEQLKTLAGFDQPEPIVLYTPEIAELQLLAGIH